MRLFEGTIFACLGAVLILWTELAGVAMGADIKDLFLPQCAAFYLRADYDAPLLESAFQQKRDEEWNARYFSPWTADGFAHSVSDLLYPWRVYGDREIFGENGRPRESSWLDGLLREANFAAFRSLDIRGVILEETNLRALPTGKPLFLAPPSSYEGFPFDYAQVSALNVGEPVRISHLSEDRSWALVETGYAAGWIDSRRVAAADDYFAEIRGYANRPLVAVTKDGVAMCDSNGRFRSHVRIGSVFPLKKDLLYEYEVALPASDGSIGAKVVSGSISKGASGRKPIPFTPRNVANLIDEMLGASYGWGGLYGNRDCSAAVRDLFTPFGIWLPRNSADQAAWGRTVSLQGLPREEKEKRIVEEGIPFATLLYKEGHIVLYIGHYRGRAMIFHNMWGIKTLEGGAEGRHVVGKAVITTLSPGAELADLHPDGLLIDAITAMTFLVPSERSGPRRF